MNNQDWTPEEEEAFNAVEKSSNLGKQILRDIEGQPYVYPPKREWVGLTELEKAEITSLKWWDWEDTFDIEGFIKAIEAKLKEKNDRTL
jgi:hypothetical protein